VRLKSNGSLNTVDRVVREGNDWKPNSLQNRGLIFKYSWKPLEPNNG